jgi:protein TonB
MSNGGPGLAASRYYDEPLQRLPWLLPVAFLIIAAALLGFLRLLAMPPAIPHPPTAIAMQVIELPPEPQHATPPPEPVPAPALRPEPKKAMTPPPRPQPAQPPPPQPAAPQSQSIAPGNMGARALYQPMPEIPEELRRANLDLVAVARFRVAANGAATIELVQPTPEPRLNSALLDALKRWRFFPAMENGRPVDSTVDIRIPISVR